MAQYEEFPADDFGEYQARGMQVTNKLITKKLINNRFLTFEAFSSSFPLEHFFVCFNSLLIRLRIQNLIVRRRIFSTFFSVSGLFCLSSQCFCVSRHFLLLKTTLHAYAIFHHETQKK